jgi:hypothetical protein
LAYEPTNVTNYTDFYSNLIDTKGFESAEIMVIVSALTGVDGSNSILPVLQECDTTVGTSFTAVATADMIGAFTLIDSSTEDSVIERVGYIGNKRYLRVKIDYTGTSISAGVVGVVGLLGNAIHTPGSDVTPVSST